MDIEYFNVPNVASTAYHNRLKAIKFAKEQIYKSEFAMNAIKTLDVYNVDEKEEVCCQILDTLFHEAFYIEKGYWMYTLDGALVSSDVISDAFEEILKEFR